MQHDLNDCELDEFAEPRRVSLAVLFRVTVAVWLRHALFVFDCVRVGVNVDHSTVVGLAFELSLRRAVVVRHELELCERMLELLTVGAAVLVPSRILEYIGERERQRRRLPVGVLLRHAVLNRVRPRVAELKRQCERNRAQLRKCFCFADAYRVSFREQLAVAVALCLPDAHTSRNCNGLTLCFLVWFRVVLAV